MTPRHRCRSREHSAFGWSLHASLVLALALTACGASEPAEPPAASPEPRAALIFEPPRLAVGEVSRVEIAVTTPPGHRVHPPAPPDADDGFWVIGIEPPVLEKQPGRWIHRMEIRLRARSVGRFTWPASRVSVEAPDGEILELDLAEQAFDVVSVFPEFPEQVAPFGLELPEPAEAPGTPAWLAAAAGATLALAAVAGLAAVRRRRRAPARATEPGTPMRPPPWVEARQELEAATRALERDPVAAAHLASLALRRYVGRRYGADAPVRTTEELLAGRAPAALRARWSGLLELLAELDAARFRGRRVEPAALAEALERAREFVDDAVVRRE